MKHMKLTDLKEYLNSLNTEELREEIVELFKNFSNIKDFYGSKLDEDYELNLLVKFKTIISNEFWNEDRKGPTLSHKVCRESIKEFQRVSTDSSLVADLMFFYTENGVEYANTYNDLDEKFYIRILKSYEDAINFALNNELGDEFADKARELTDESDKIGGGFAQDMIDLFYDTLATEDDFEEEITN